MEVPDAKGWLLLTAATRGKDWIKKRFIIFIPRWMEGEDSVHFISCQHLLYIALSVPKQFKVDIRMLLIKISKDAG